MRESSVMRPFDVKQCLVTCHTYFLGFTYQLSYDHILRPLGLTAAGQASSSAAVVTYSICEQILSWGSPLEVKSARAHGL
jgi:hypothetical protein